MPSKRKAIEAQWEHHRKELHTLYLADNMTLKGVMSHMKDKYGFNAT
jgi:hypothetical protein